MIEVKNDAPMPRQRRGRPLLPVNESIIHTLGLMGEGEYFDIDRPLFAVRSVVHREARRMKRRFWVTQHEGKTRVWRKG